MNAVLLEGLCDVGLFVLVGLVLALTVSQMSDTHPAKAAVTFVVSVAVVFVLSLAAAAVRMIIAQ